MKIIKTYKLKDVKFFCPFCRNEFETSEYEPDFYQKNNAAEWRASARCPVCSFKVGKELEVRWMEKKFEHLKPINI